MKKLRILVEPGKRFDAALTEALNLQLQSEDTADVDLPLSISRSQVLGIIKNDGICFLDSKQLSASTKVLSSITVEVSLPEYSSDILMADPSVKLDVLYEDRDIIVINKQSNLAVHSGSGEAQATLVGGLIHHLGESITGIGESQRPGIVHRLDKDTTGVMVVAKTQSA